MTLINMDLLKMIKAEKADFEELYNIILESSEWLKSQGIRQWNPPYPSHRFLSEIECGIVYYFVVKNNKIGTVTLFENKPFYYPEKLWNKPIKAWYICRLAVHRWLKGNSFGTYFLQTIEEKAKQKEIHNLRLDVLSANPFLENYYIKFGFNPILQAKSHGTLCVFMEKII